MRSGGEVLEHTGDTLFKTQRTIDTIQLRQGLFGQAGGVISETRNKLCTTHDLQHLKTGIANAMIGCQRRR